MLGSPTVSSSGSASRMASTSRKVSCRVCRMSMARHQLAEPAFTGAKVTVPLPGLKSFGTGRPG